MIIFCFVVYYTYTMTSLMQQIKAMNTKVDTLELGSGLSPLIENGTSVTSNYSLVFNKKLSKSSIPGANDIANDSEGNIYVITDDDVIKFDKITGEVIWIVENIDAGGGEAILVDKDDNIICVGGGYINSNNKKYSQEGSLHFFRKFMLAVRF